MKENEIFKIRININGSILPLNIVRKEEEVYRKAEKIVMRILKDYQKKYNQKSYDQILTYVAFKIAVAYAKKDSDEELLPLAEKIKILDAELEQLLENK